MSDVRFTPLPYRPDSCDYFATLRELPGAVFLDSARPACARGRFDIMAASPLVSLVTRDGVTRSVGPDGESESREDPFALLQQACRAHLPGECTMTDGWPFTGGAIGYFGYDLGRAGARLAPRPGAGVPEMLAGVYGWAVMQDHDRRLCTLVTHPAVGAREQAAVMARVAGAASAESEPFRLHGPFVSNLSRAAYASAFARIQEYIRAGDCYQINLAQRLSAPCSGDPWLAYRHLRGRMASPHSAFLEVPGGAVLSFSPERFLQVDRGRVETRPIKGTARRSSNPAQDRASAERLLASEKDRAENIMIVDLLRNDLGKSCRTGSVRVDTLCGLESYANVHHLVSVVGGRLRPDRSPLGLLADCFPGGSITGAPKIRAMQIIDELEPDARGVYCGSVGYLSTSGVMDTSIAIRTLVCADGQVHAFGGGGIVADSDCDTEYRESLTKIEPLLNGLIDCAAQRPLRAGARARSRA